MQCRLQLRDPGDELVFEAAINGRADALVTCNVRDFRDAAPLPSIRIARAVELLMEILVVERISVTALIACLFAPLPVLAQGQTTQADVPSLTVRGSGVVEIPPDFARLSVDVVTRGPTLDGVSKAHQARVAGTGAVLDKLKADGVIVRQGAFNLVQEPARTVPGTNMRVEPATFRAETSYVLETKSLDKVDAEVGYAIASGLFELTGISYGVEHRDEGLNQARRAAVADARGQADTYADAAGIRLDGIRRIVDGEARSAEGSYDLPLRSAAPVGITPPKTIPFTAEVTITWQIAPS